MRSHSSRRLPVWLVLMIALPVVAILHGSDWPDWRGPARTGVSDETNLPSKWSTTGENLAWQVPYGGRSGPVVFGDHLYLQNTSASGATEQERVMCFNADTGKLLWEHRYNMFTSDVPAHRLAWSSPVVDWLSGNVFAISANGLVMSLSKDDGKVLWERSLAEEMGMWTTHGGRMSSPIIDGKQLIVSGLTFSWGQYAGGAHRFISLDTATGQILWVSAPEGRPTDTIYANPYVANVNGTRLFFSGGSDGAMHALKIATGEPVWHWNVSKRGLNTSALMVGPDVIVTHSEENMDVNEMGMIAAVPAASKGTLTDKDARWIVRDVQAGYGSPVSDGQRIYVVDNGGVLLAFDVKDGRHVWRKNLGTIQKSSPVLADGKLYVGTENGKFYVLRPKADGVDVLDEDEMPPGTDGKPSPIIASPAVARGRIYVVSMDNMFAIGPKSAPKGIVSGNTGPVTAPGPVASILVTPTEQVIKPGTPLALSIRGFDANGHSIEKSGEATWTLENLKGTIANGTFTPDPAAGAQAGLVKASVGSIAGAARIRVIPDLPWTYDFESSGETPPAHWVNATGKFAVRALDGNKVLVKLAENPFAFAKRCRVFFGGPDYTDYTIEADVRAMEKRRQRGDVGIVAQRYEMMLSGSHERIELQPWQPETQRTVKADFPWKADTWYTMKLEVQSLGGDKVRARGKVWAKGEPEPATWAIERIDPIGSTKGAPGLYADAPSAAGGGSEIYYDNIKVYKNK
jgi:outer membrane protein assembly factor BamB